MAWKVRELDRMLIEMKENGVRIHRKLRELNRMNNIEIRSYQITETR